MLIADKGPAFGSLEFGFININVCSTVFNMYLLSSGLLIFLIRVYPLGKCANRLLSASGLPLIARQMKVHMARNASIC